MRIISALVAITVFLVVALSVGVAKSQSPAPVATTSDVCAALDLLNRSLDQVLTARRLQIPREPLNHEQGMRLEHAYQLHMACLEQLHEIEAQRQIGRIPPLASSRPMQFRADDVVELSRLMHDELKRPAWILWVVKLPEERANLQNKSTDDAFLEALRLYVKMNALAEKRQVGADEVTAQLTRCVADAKVVLQHLDAAHRYRIDAPTVDGSRQPSDVYARCLAIRRTLQRIAQELNQSATPVPAAEFPPAGEDVFVQTQIVLAELNRLKLATGVASNTPLAIRAPDKTWADAYQQAVLADYLLSQFSELRRLAGGASQP